MDSYYEHIEDYLNGELDDLGRQAFESALQADPELQVAVARQRKVIERLQAARLRQKVKANRARPVSGAAGLARLYSRLMLVFAGLVLLSAAVYFWFRRPAERPPANGAPGGQTPAPQDIRKVEEKAPVAGQPAPANPKYPAPKPTTPDMEPLTSDAAVRTACAEIANHLERADFNVMGEARKDTALENKLDAAVFFLKSQKPAGALALLDTVRAADNPLYREYAQWIEALAWMLRDPAQGKIRLDAIAADPAHPYRPDALRLQRRLK